MKCRASNLRNLKFLITPKWYATDFARANDLDGGLPQLTSINTPYQCLLASELVKHSYFGYFRSVTQQLSCPIHKTPVLDYNTWQRARVTTNSDSLIIKKTALNKVAVKYGHGVFAELSIYLKMESFCCVN